VRIVVVTGIFPPDVGGPATYVPFIATELVRRGHDVSVITASPARGHDDHAYPFAVARVIAPSLALRLLEVVRTLRRLAARADVIFVNGLALEATIANVALRRPLVEKIVGDIVWERAFRAGATTDRMEVFQRRRHGWKIEMEKSLRRWWVRRATRVIVPSRFLAGIVDSWGVERHRIDVIANAAFRPMGTLPTATPRRAGRRRIFTAGRLVPWKGMAEVIEAVAEVPGVDLVIAGDGPDRPRLERSVRAGMDVTFLGEIDVRRVWAELMVADVFVLNSTYEGLPHVVLEALATGTPVVATAAGGTPELIVDGRNGRLVAPGDGDALRKAIVEAMTWPRTRVADDAGQAAVARLTADTLNSLERAANMVRPLGPSAVVSAPSSSQGDR